MKQLDGIVLDARADDYVLRPFDTAELLACIRAALRSGTGTTAHSTASFDAGDFRVDLERRRIYVRANEVRLTPKEFDLFVYMARQPNRVIPHRTLLVAVWGVESCEHRQYLHVLMRRLRRKLEANPSNPRYLITEAWVGYRFNPGIGASL